MPAMSKIVSSGLLFAVAATAQCQFASVSIQTFGAGCNPVFVGNNPSIGGRLDVNSCTLGLQVNAFSGCCNTYLWGRMLVLGLAQVNVPVPQVGVGCTLLARPDVLLFLPTSAGDTFALSLPPLLPPGLVLFAQAAAHYFTTIGFSDDFALSPGATVTLN